MNNVLTAGTVVEVVEPRETGAGCLVENDILILSQYCPNFRKHDKWLILMVAGA